MLLKIVSPDGGSKVLISGNTIADIIATAIEKFELANDHYKVTKYTLNLTYSLKIKKLD